MAYNVNRGLGLLVRASEMIYKVSWVIVAGGAGVVGMLLLAVPRMVPYRTIDTGSICCSCESGHIISD